MFETHKLNEKGFEEIREAKSNMLETAEFVMNLMPEGRDRSLFKTKLEEAMFFGTRAIASKKGNFTEIIRYTNEQE